MAAVLQAFSSASLFCCARSQKRARERMCLEEEQRHNNRQEKLNNSHGSDLATLGDNGRPAIQKLYDTCKSTFTSGTPPSSRDLQRVHLVLDSIKPVDVGLDENMPPHSDRGFGFFQMRNGRKFRHSSRWAPPISYLHIYECKDFSMGIFCLPSSAVIPLHNHPGMTVFSKLLYGSMHVKAYDWVNPMNSSSCPRLAKLVVDRTMMAPCESAVLYPTSGGNMHVFTAVTSCAVLDVLAPPYSSEDGRHCTYYRDFPYSAFPSATTGDGGEDAELAWLEESQPPGDFDVEAAPYLGPRIAGTG